MELAFVWNQTLNALHIHIPIYEQYVTRIFRAVPSDEGMSWQALVSAVVEHILREYPRSSSSSCTKATLFTPVQYLYVGIQYMYAVCGGNNLESSEGLSRDAAEHTHYIIPLSVRRSAGRPWERHAEKSM